MIKRRVALISLYFLISFVILFFFMDFASGATKVLRGGNCPGALAESGTYLLNGSIVYDKKNLDSGMKECIKILEQGTELDCQGNTITISGSRDIEAIALYSNQRNTAIRNCIIKLGSDDTGIFLDRAEMSNARENEIFGDSIGKIGIFVNASNSILANNALSFLRIGIDIESSNSVVSNNKLKTNELGINLEGDSNSISYNYFEENSQAVFLNKGKQNNISYNFMASNNIGALFFNSLFNTFYFNTLLNNSYGAELVSSRFNEIRFNVISNNAERGVFLHQSSNDNTIANNTLALNGFSIEFDDSSAGNTIESNSITGMEGEPAESDDGSSEENIPEEKESMLDYLVIYIGIGIAVALLLVLLARRSKKRKQENL